MGRQGLVWMVLAAWVVLAAASVVVPILIPATDFGMSRGLNRVVWFAQLQLAAIAVALLCFFMARRLAPGWRRWLARAPLLVELALGLVFVGMILWGNMQRTAPGAGPPPAGPVTAPATESGQPASKPSPP